MSPFPAQELKHFPLVVSQAYPSQEPEQAVDCTHTPFTAQATPAAQSVGLVQGLLQFCVSVLQVYTPQPAEQATGVGGTHTLLLHTAPATTQSSAVAHAIIQAEPPWVQAYVLQEEQSKAGGGTHTLSVHDAPATTQSVGVAHVV